MVLLFKRRVYYSLNSKTKTIRTAGIEPAYSAWKAAILPLNYVRIVYVNYHANLRIHVTTYERMKPAW